MVCGRPVITGFSKESFHRCHAYQPPLLCAFTAEEIFNHMVKFAMEPELIKKIGIANKKWVSQNLDSKVVLPKYIELIKQILP